MWQSSQYCIYNCHSPWSMISVVVTIVAIVVCLRYSVYICSYKTGQNSNSFSSVCSMFGWDMNRAKTNNEYSRTSIIRIPVCHFYVKSVQMSELSDKTTLFS